MHEFLTIHQLAEELAKLHALPPVEIANRLLSASMRGEFDGHMRIGGEEFLGRDLIDAAQKHGLVRYDSLDDVIPIHRVDLEALTFADYPTSKGRGYPNSSADAFYYRDVYLDELRIDKGFAVEWYENWHEATRLKLSVIEDPAKAELKSHSSFGSVKLPPAHRPPKQTEKAKEVLRTLSAPDLSQNLADLTEQVNCQLKAQHKYPVSRKTVGKARVAVMKERQARLPPP